LVDVRRRPSLDNGGLFAREAIALAASRVSGTFNTMFQARGECSGRAIGVDQFDRAAIALTERSANAPERWQDVQGPPARSPHAAVAVMRCQSRALRCRKSTRSEAVARNAKTIDVCRRNTACNRTATKGAMVRCPRAGDRATQ